PWPPLFPYTTLFRSDAGRELRLADSLARSAGLRADAAAIATQRGRLAEREGDAPAAGRFYTLAADTARAIGATKLLWEPLFYLRSEEHTSELQSREN